MNIRILQELNYRHFEEMEALELQFYGAEFITPPQESWQWYRHHPHSTVAAAADDRIVGFVNLFPVKEPVYHALAEGRFNDHFMTLDDVADVTTTPLHMFLSCVVVAEAARKYGVTRQLLRAAAQAYNGRPCLSVITDNVTEAGCAFSEHYGFIRRCRSDHNSWIYEQPWSSFADNIGGLL